MRLDRRMGALHAILVLLCSGGEINGTISCHLLKSAPHINCGQLAGCMYKGCAFNIGTNEM